jgi:hypothetical protein
VLPSPTPYVVPIVENRLAYVVRLTASPLAGIQPGGVDDPANHIIDPIGILSLVVAVVLFRFHLVPSYTHVVDPEAYSSPLVGEFGKFIGMNHLLLSV